MSYQMEEKDISDYRKYLVSEERESGMEKIFFLIKQERHGIVNT